MSFNPANDPSFPFSGFEAEEIAYTNSRMFWQAAFDEVLGEHLTAWQDWMADPFKDGHPIFSAFDPDARRGVLLQQVEETDDPAWFKCWVSDIDGAGEGERIPYLFMETHVSRGSRDVFQTLVRHWCERRADERSMDRLTAHVMRDIAAVPGRSPVGSGQSN